MGQDGKVIRGAAAIREALSGFLALRARYSQQPERVVEAGGVALLTTRWSLEGTGADGKPFRMGGRTADVARRQADGSWLVAIDSPFGGGPA